MTTAAIAQFIRHLPLSSLKACLGCYVPLLAANINWPDDAQQLTAIFKKLYKKNCPTHEEMHLLAERVNGMTDEEGQAALACSIENKSQFNALQNAHERAAWVLMHEPSAFRHAEEIRYADLNRRGQMWDTRMISSSRFITFLLQLKIVMNHLSLNHSLINQTCELGVVYKLCWMS